MKNIGLAILNHQNKIILKCNRSGLILESNDSSAKILGLSKNEIENQNIISLIEKDDVALFKIYFLENQNFPTTNTIGLSFKRKNLPSLQLTFEVFNDIDTNFYYLYSLEINQYEDNITVYSETNKKGIITKVNKQFCKTSQYSPEELIGKTHSIVNSQIHPDSFFKNIWTVILSGNNWNGEICNINKNGDFYWLHTQIFPLYKHDNSEITGFYSIQVDITKNKNLESKLKKATIWIESSLNSTTDCIFSTDPSGVITTFNKAAVETLGYEADEVIFKSSPAILHSANEIEAKAKDLSEEYNQTIMPGIEVITYKANKLGSDTCEWSFTTKDGTKIPVELSTTCLLNNKGEIIGHMFRAVNLSKVKLLNKTIDDHKAHIVTSAKLSALGEMASNIAHEINNPLSIIHSNALLLIDQLENSNTEQSIILKGLNKILTTTERINKIVKGLRSISRNADDDDYDFLDLKKLTDEVKSLTEQKLKNKSINFSIELPEESISIQCAGTQIFQILINLINNSIDAIELQSDKWISIVFKKINNNHTIRCELTDSGPGIPTHIIEKLMVPFFTTKPIGKGTGLGLSITKGIIEKHNGRFFLDDSCINTRFVFEIPIINKKGTK